MSENLNLPVPNSVLEPYIKAAVSTAITAALGDGAKLVEAAVQQALTAKVDANGNVSSSSYSNQHLLADVVSRNSIHKIATETIQEMAEGMRPQIRAEIEKQLKDKHGQLASAMVDGLIESLKTTWNINVSVEPKKKEY